MRLAPWKKESPDVRAGDPPPQMGGRPRCRFGPEPRGDPRYPGDRACLGEPVDRREDPELSRCLLPDHPGLPAVAPAAARSLARGRESLLPGQHPGGEAARRDVARD